MGCNVSRLDSHGPTFPSRLRPLLLQRFDEIKARRHHACHPLKEPTPSKKELLSPDDIDRNADDEIQASQHLLPHPNPSENDSSFDAENLATKPIDKSRKHITKNDHDAIKVNVVKYGDGPRTVAEDDHVKVKAAEDVFTDVEDDDAETDYDDVDDDDSDGASERRIGRGEDGAFPSSPSFRVYFKDNEVIGGHGGIAKDDNSKKKLVSCQDDVSSKGSSMEKKVMKGKKKRNFRKVLPRNLLGMKSCYTPSHSQMSSVDNSQFLDGKTMT